MQASHCCYAGSNCSPKRGNLLLPLPNRRPDVWWGGRFGEQKLHASAKRRGVNEFQHQRRTARQQSPKHRLSRSRKTQTRSGVHAAAAAAGQGSVNFEELQTVSSPSSNRNRPRGQQLAQAVITNVKDAAMADLVHCCIVTSRTPVSRNHFSLQRRTSSAVPEAVAMEMALAMAI